MSFETPQSRNEAILQNILGAENTLPEPQSRIEAILQAILNHSAEIPSPYTSPPQSRNEELLVEIWQNGGGGGDTPIDPDSLTPIVFGIDENGFYMSDNQADATPYLIGRDNNGLYVKEVTNG